MVWWGIGGTAQQLTLLSLLVGSWVLSAVFYLVRVERQGCVWVVYCYTVRLCIPATPAFRRCRTRGLLTPCGPLTCEEPFTCLFSVAGAGKAARHLKWQPGVRCLPLGASEASMRKLQTRSHEPYKSQRGQEAAVKTLPAAIVYDRKGLLGHGLSLMGHSGVRKARCSCRRPCY